MLPRLIEFCLENRSRFIALALLVATAGVLAAIPEVSGPQVQVLAAGGTRAPLKVEKFASQEVGQRKLNMADDDLTGGQRANILVLEAPTAAWFFVFGSVWGSFLNVVIYRVPRGMRLSTPPSQCPNCGTHIWRRDNLPIISWLSLRGRCRACQCRIPYRYPLVEALVAATFLALSYVELLSGGTNLPVRMPNFYAGVIWIIWYTKWDLVGIYLFHCCLLCLMLACFLIVRDGFLLPRRLIAFGLVLAVTVSAVFRDVHPVPFSISTSVLMGRTAGTIDNAQMNWPHFWASAPGWLGGFADAVCGAIVGLIVGLPLPLGEVESAARRRCVRNVPTMTALAGAYLGWQAAVSVCLLTAMSGMVLKVGVSRSIPSTGLIRFETLAAFATIVQVFCWKSLDGISGWPSATASRQSLVMPLAALGSYVLTTRLLSPRDHECHGVAQ